MKLQTLASLVASSLLFTACSQPAPPSDSAQPNTTGEQTSEVLDKLNKGEALTVGTEGTYAPFTYHDESGKLTGYDVEVVRAVAQKMGVPVEFKETQWDAMMAGLDAKRFDAVANQVSLTTPERQAKYNKATPYSWSGPVALARQDDPRFTSWQALKGLSSAQSLSSNYGEMAEKYQATIIPVDGMAQAIELVKQKRADFTLNDKLAVLDYLKKHPESGLQIKLEAGDEEKRGSGIIFRKDETALVEKVNQAMAELQQDGTLTKLSEQFFGEDISQAPKTDQTNSPDQDKNSDQNKDQTHNTDSKADSQPDSQSGDDLSKTSN